MAIKSNDLNKELNAMKKWLNYLNEDNRIGVGHFPNDERSPDYRESCGEGSELGNQPDSEMSGYMSEEEEVDDNLYEFTIPEWAVSALINGDTSGLEDEDVKKVESFVNNTSARYGNANFSLPSDDQLELGFCRTNDIDSLGSNCYKLLLRVDKVGEGMAPKEKAAWKRGIDHDVEQYDQHHGAMEEDNEEHGHEEEIGDVKIGMAIMSHLSDLQMRVDDESRKKLNFIKAMVNILIDKGNTWVTDDELDGLYHQWMNK